MPVAHQRLEVAAVQMAADRAPRAGQRPAAPPGSSRLPHQVQLGGEPHGDDLVNRALGSEHCDAGPDVWRQPEPMDAVKALKESADCEVSVHEDCVVALVVEPDALAEPGWVGESDHAVRVGREPLPLDISKPTERPV